MLAGKGCYSLTKSVNGQPFEVKKHELPILLRDSFSICSLQDRYVYLTGGSDRLKKVTDKVERFDMTVSKWETMASLNDPR